MPADTPPAIIVFDGVCVLCNGWVRFLLRHDRGAHFRFAAMQSDAGRALLSEHGLDANDPTSFLLIDAQGAWTDTQAIRRVLSNLGGRWQWLSVAIGCLPRPLRDTAYRMLARNRYRWFGRHDHCLIPTPETAGRFLS